METLKILHEVCRQIENERTPALVEVIYNNPVTIAKWSDGTKTVMNCTDNYEIVPLKDESGKVLVDRHGNKRERRKYLPSENYSEVTGLLLCIAKKAFGNGRMYKDVFRTFCPSFFGEDQIIDSDTEQHEGHNTKQLEIEFTNKPEVAFSERVAKKIIEKAVANKPTPAPIAVENTNKEVVEATVDPVAETKPDVLDDIMAIPVTPIQPAETHAEEVKPVQSVEVVEPTPEPVVEPTVEEVKPEVTEEVKEEPHANVIMPTRPISAPEEPHADIVRPTVFERVEQPTEAPVQPITEVTPDQLMEEPTEAGLEDDDDVEYIIEEEVTPLPSTEEAAPTRPVFFGDAPSPIVANETHYVPSDERINKFVYQSL